MKKIFKKKNNIVWTLLLAGVFVFGAMFYFVSGNEEQKESEEINKNLVEVETLKIEAKKFSREIAFSATADPYGKIEIYPETNARISAVYFKEGDYVKKGQSLISLETDPVLAENLRNAQKNLEIVRQNLENTEKLQKQLKEDADGTPAEDSTKRSARLTVDSSEGQVKIAEGQVQLARSQMNKYIIKSPANGFIEHFNFKTGDLVMMNAPLAIVSNSQKMEVSSGLSEEEISQVNLAQTAEIYPDSFSEEKIIGKIYYLAKTADSASKKFPVKIEFDNPENRIKGGSVVRVKILTMEKEGAMVVPATAIFQEGDMQKIYTVRDSKVSIKTIKAEKIDEEEYCIKEGLEFGEEIVLNGNYELQEGEKILIRNK